MIDELWKGVGQGVSGLTGNPLFMAGVRGLSAARGGGDWGAAMAEGAAGANQMKTARAAAEQQQREFALRQQQFASQQEQMARQAEMQGFTLEQARAQAERDAQNRAYWQDPATQTQMAQLGIPEGVPPAMAQALFTQAMGHKLDPGSWSSAGDGVLFNTKTGARRGGVGGGAGGGGPWSLKSIASEYELAKYRPEAVMKAIQSGDPVSHLTADTLAKGPVDPADWKKVRDTITDEMKLTQEVFGSYTRIKDLLRGTKGGPGELAALVAFTKLLDPQSVAREGEVALAQSATSFVDYIQNLKEKLPEGSVLGPEQRVLIEEAADVLVAGYADRDRKLRENFLPQIQAMGFTEKGVMPPELPWETWGPLRRQAPSDVQRILNTGLSSTSQDRLRAAAKVVR